MTLDSKGGGGGSVTRVVRGAMKGDITHLNINPLYS